MLNKLQDLQLNFVGNRKKFYIISVAIIVVALICALVFGVKMDINFKGGTIITYSYTGEIDEKDFTNTVKESFGDNLTVLPMVSSVTGENQFEVTLNGNKSVDLDTVSDALEKLQETFADNEVEQTEVNTVNETMGREFLLKCIVALILASALIILYIAFRFRTIGGLSAGVMGIVALLHDCMIVFSVYVLFSMSIDSNFMAVVLMIIGYSINDTIVIYDRIRENMRKNRSMELEELVNTSLNQVKVRCLNTSITSISVMIVVCIISFVFHVPSIRNFAFPMIMGMVSGVYSSLCLAPNLWIDYCNYKKNHINSKKAEEKNKVKA